MNHKIANSSIFLKITVVFITVIFILCAVYLYSYVTSMKLLEQEKILALRNAGNSQIQTIDHQISNAKRAIYNSYATQNWNSLAMKTGYVDNYVNLKEVTSAGERIRVILDNSEIIGDVYIHFPRWGRSISANNGLVEYDQERWENIMMPADSVGAQIVYCDDYAYITTRYQMTNPQLYSVDAELSFEKSFQTFGDYAMLGVPINNYLIDMGSGKILMKHEAIIDKNGLLLQTILSPDFDIDNQTSVKLDGKSYLILSAASSYSNLRVINIVPPGDLIKPFVQQSQLVIIFTILMALSIVFVLLFIKRDIVNPINLMIQAFKPLEKGDFSASLQAKSNDEFATLYSSFNLMVQNLQILVNEVYQKELLVKHADLKQLQSQINPHFMYNSLYALSTMIKIGDNENADQFCMYLASYFRYITRSGSDLMTLSDEWQHAVVYLNIMTMRNSNIQLDFQKELPEQVKNLLVPRLIIQPIIENTFKHGGKTVTNLKLKITAACEDSYLYIRVEDNGKGISDSEIAELGERMNDLNSGQEITGLINIHRRLRLMFGQDSGLFFSRSRLGGICVTVTLNLKGEE